MWIIESLPNRLRWIDQILARHISDYPRHSHQVANILIEVDGAHAKSKASHI
jgi:hypothetical protein